MKALSTRVLILTLTFSLCGLPEALAQAAKPLPDAPSAVRLVAQNAAPTNPQPAATQDPAQPEQQQPAQTAPGGDQPRVVPVDPAQAPGTEQVDQQQNDAETASQQSEPPKTIAPADPAELQQLESAQQQNQQQPATVNERVTPLGTAAAEKGKTAGGAASRPAGVAIAPAKQKRSRSLLIKIGAIAAAGAALGTVYGLSRGTKGTPQAVR